MTDGADEDRIDLGFGGLRAEAGSHIGHFYRTDEEWRDVMIPFLTVGLKRRDKCVCLVRRGGPEESVLAGLEAQGVDTSSARSSGQLVLTNGHGEVDTLKRLLEECIDEVPGRFRFLRWAGDMTWSHAKFATSEALMEWECACNVVAGAPVVFLCQYELSRFLGTVVVDALKTHPLCIMGSGIHHNPYYEAPEDFLDQIRRREPTPLQ